MKPKLIYTEAKGDEWPICPYCKQELREQKFKRRGWLTSVTAFWCPPLPLFAEHLHYF
jgi:hypothetical protein